MAEAEIEAVRDQLASWLKAQLLPQFPLLEVLPDWPDGQMAAQYAILVQSTGEADLYNHNPVTVSAAPTSGANGLVTYAYGYANEIPLSLDVWAFSKTARNAMALAVRQAMNQPPQATLAGADDGRPRPKRRGGLSLAVDGLYGAIFTYRFQAVPTVDESSMSAQQKRWRSHFRGTADGPLWDQDERALMKRIVLTGNVGPGALGAAAGNQPLSGPLAQIATVISAPALTLPHGASQQLTALAVFSDGTTSDVTSSASWSSSAPSKATVTAGLVHGVAAGAATVTASSGGFGGTSSITVS